MKKIFFSLNLFNFLAFNILCQQRRPILCYVNVSRKLTPSAAREGDAVSSLTFVMLDSELCCDATPGVSPVVLQQEALLAQVCLCFSCWRVGIPFCIGLSSWISVCQRMKHWSLSPTTPKLQKAQWPASRPEGVSMSIDSVSTHCPASRAHESVLAFGENIENSRSP